jgi:radical SAM protein with 4Fe4S-binding SPASM domain
VKVCFFTDIEEMGGGEIWALNVCRWLNGNGHTGAIAAPYGSPLYNEALRTGLDLHGFYRSDAHPFLAPLESFLERHRIDVLYCTLIGKFWESRTLVPVVERINARRTEKRLILLFKTGLPPLPSTTPEFYGVGCGSSIRRLHVVCEATRNAFLRWSPDMPAEHVEVMREGIDLQRFDPRRFVRDDCRSRWQIAPEAKVVAAIARLSPVKGHETLLLAANEIRKREPNAVFVFAGEGDDRPRLEALALQMGFNGSARFLGRVDDVPSLLAASDVVCLPSWHESLPNSLVEAASMAVPVVASDIEGIPEIIRSGENGTLVPPNDVAGFADGITRLLADEAQRAAYGERGRERVRESFDFRRNTARWLERLTEEQAEFDSSPTVALTAPSATREPVTVLFLMSVMRTGGEESEVAILAEHLDRRRFRVLVLSAFPVNEPSPAAVRLRALGVDIDEGCHSIEDFGQKVDYVAKLIRRERVRLVVACQDTALAYYVFHGISPEECRLIEHGGIISEVTRIPKDFTSRYIGVSPAIAAAAASVMPAGQSALCLPSMVDTNRYRSYARRETREKLGISIEDCVVVFAGRLDPKKRIHQLVQAAEGLLPRHEHLRFLIVGPADAFAQDYAKSLFERAAAVRATGRFVFCGARSDVAAILAASDIFVLPSVGEGMSHAINEAGAAGLAVISVDDGAARMQLDDGRAGVLIPPDSPAQLEAELEGLILEPVRRSELGTRLRARVEAEYSHSVVVPRWERLFAETLQNMPRTPIPYLRVIKEDRTRPFASEIQIQTNTVCNATCIMCPYPEVSKEFTHGWMQEDLYREILDQCAKEPTLWRIEPFLMNEPFTDKRLVDWIALAKEKVRHAVVTVTTNGTLVRPKIADRLVNSGLDAIWFSFNGATKATFEKIMGVSYDTVVQNMDYLLSIRPESLRVFTNMIETLPMEPEIMENIHRWQQRGVQSGPSKLVNRAGNVSNFTELNYRPLGSEATHICDLLYHKLYVLYTGEVVLCCMDWRRKVILGNVREQSLRDIWRGERYQHYRRLHEEGRSSELDLCSSCSYVLN